MNEDYDLEKRIVILIPTQLELGAQKDPEMAPQPLLASVLQVAIH